MHIEISNKTFHRLQALARPLIDSVDDVIVRLIENQREGGVRMQQSTAETARVESPRDQLRGLQRELWELVIERMPTQRFTLRDVYERKQPLVDRRPHVQEIEASIRAALEKLRDKGLVEFIDNRGTYRRLA